LQHARGIRNTARASLFVSPGILRTFTGACREDLPLQPEENFAEKFVGVRRRESAAKSAQSRLIRCFARMDKAIAGICQATQAMAGRRGGVRERNGDLRRAVE
jgi:hypothetical protein